MEKRRPTYDLDAVKHAIGSVESLAMTTSARRDAFRLGFDSHGVVETILRIERRMFFKSMTTYADSRVWQDVYHVTGERRDALREVPGRRHHGVHRGFVQGEIDVAIKSRTLPDTMISPETGETLRRDIRPVVLSYKGRSVTVDLPGYYPDGDGDGVHVGNDMAVTDAALRALKETLDGTPSPATIRRVRTKLKLSQRDAGALLKVGEKAFDKYERGLVEPSGPTIQLLKLLDRHPEMADELK